MDKKTKKKKQVKKYGLAKYLQPEVRSKKRSQDSDKVQVNAHNLGEKAKVQEKPVVTMKKHQKNLSLVDRCKLQMSSSLLRLVDEKLYTSDSSNIPLTEEEFVSYHQAYSSVCDKWPTKPIDYIVKFIKKRLLAKKPVQKFKFADIGCGRQPLLKMKLPPKARVQSFDLVTVHEDIIQANMDSLPLDDESINCAVYSLSLMAKNLGSILVEARRVLKLNGSLLIVEVTSRFEGKEKRFIEKVEKIGFKKRSTAILKPNGYFTFFHFTKNEPGQYKCSSGVNIELKPCIYKAR